MKLNIYGFVLVAAMVISVFCDGDLKLEENTRQRLKKSEARYSKRAKRTPIFGFNVAFGKKPRTNIQNPRPNSALDSVMEMMYGTTTTPPNRRQPDPDPPTTAPILDPLTTENPVSGCILPEQPFGGDYEVVGCVGSCNRNQGSRVHVGSILQYKCKEGYAFRGEKISYCTNSNTWFNHPTCVKMCDPLQSDSVDIACSYQGKNVSCESKMMPRTKATLACKPFYTISTSSGIVYKRINCQEGGLWDRPMYHCNPECGRSLSHGTPLIVNGNIASHGVAPWHVAIYENYTNGSYQQICGGSLISSKLVVSAAHCFYSDILRTTRSATEFAVAAGKYYRSYDLEEQAVQKSLVGLIKVPERYYGTYGNQAQDIALVRVQTPFNLNARVRPVCMDWENIYEREHLQPTIFGKVVGWGITEQHMSSEELREINLPYVSYQQCMSAVPNDFRSLVTPDKFCAGYLNGTSLCNGDSGGGLTFSNGDFWFLRGVVSVSPTNQGMCDNQYYTAFTNVGYFREWIQDALSSLM